MFPLLPLDTLDATRFDSAAILKRLTTSSRKLAELKGIAASIPNQGILINTLGLQEAKDSSEIENIVTTHDDLFREDVLPEASQNLAAKEVQRYRQALMLGYAQVRETGLITANHIIAIQAELEQNNAGFRKLPGTALKNGAGQTVYTPPQNPAEIVALMGDLERFLNDAEHFPADPLIKMDLVGLRTQRSVYFDLNSAVVRIEFDPALQAHARYLIANPKSRVRVEGNADERGAPDYNVRLGLKRAENVRQTMIGHGAPAKQITVKTLGESRPKLTGHDEESWAENRRAEVVYEREN